MCAKDSLQIHRQRLSCLITIVICSKYHLENWNNFITPAAKIKSFDFEIQSDFFLKKKVKYKSKSEK